MMLKAPHSALSTLHRSTTRWVSRRLYSTRSTVSRFAEVEAIPQSKLDEFHQNGYCVIDEFLTESEVSGLEVVYERFMSGSIPIEGKDFCDMSQKDGFFTSLEEMRMVNAMLPRMYYPEWRGNIYEQKTRALIDRLYPKEFEMDIDYDQLLAKRPQQKEAIFAFHQDAAYWPDLKGRNEATCTFSLALDATTLDNGCIAFLAGSHRESKVREHRPVSNREEAHAIGLELNDDEMSTLQYAQVPRGGISLHNDKIIHGSLGNLTDGWRRTYVLAFRTGETIQYERSIGFTHSHNDVQCSNEYITLQ